jgi:hypothetical protein
MDTIIPAIHGVSRCRALDQAALLPGSADMPAANTAGAGRG